MDACLKSSVYIGLVKKTPQTHLCSSSQILPTRRFSTMATTLSSTQSVGLSQTSAMPTLSSTPAVGLSETFARLKKSGKVAFIPYITAGDPYLSTTAEALKVLDSCGSDIIELGIPHSDPLADGPVIRDSAARSLARGASVSAILSMLKEVVPQLSCPIVLFSYYNPILKCGIPNFMSAIKAAGVHGLLVPDAPFEETEILRKEAMNNNIELVLHTTPTTSSSRMKTIVEASEGFVYLVSSRGVTGIRASVNDEVKTLLQQVKETTPKPVAVGFGLSRPEHVKKVAEWGADGVIVGSAIVKLLGEANSPEQGLKDMGNFVKSLISALNPL